MRRNIGNFYVISTKKKSKQNLYKCGINTGGYKNLIGRYQTYFVIDYPVIYDMFEVTIHHEFEDDFLELVDEHRVTFQNGEKSEWIILPLDEIMELIKRVLSNDKYEVLRDITINSEPLTNDEIVSPVDFNVNEMYEIFEGLDNGYLHYEENKFGVIIDVHDNPWFNGRDVVNYIGHKKQRHAVQNLVDKEDREMLSNIKYIGEKQKVHHNTCYINEYGLYQLIMSSRLDVNINFKHWMLKKVLPYIRKYMYFLQKNKCVFEVKVIERNIKWLENERKRFIDKLCETKTGISKKVHIVDVSTKTDELYHVTSLDTDTLDETKIVYFKTSNYCDLIEACIGTVLNNNKYVHNGKIKQDTYHCSFDNVKSVFDKVIRDVCKIKKVGGSKSSCKKLQTDAYTEYYTNFIKGHVQSNRENIATLNTKIEQFDKFVNSDRKVFAG